MADETTDAKNLLSPKAYDTLKFIAQIFLPALGTLYFTLSGEWGLPYGSQVVGTITAVDLFLGVVLGFSSRRYYSNGSNFDGELKMVSDETGTEKVVFDVATDPEEAIKTFGKHSFQFKVNRNPTRSS